MEQFKIQLKFVKDAQKRLLLTYEIFHKKRKISLNLTELMQFLYANESTLDEKTSEFLFFISKVTKKFTYKTNLIYGIVNNNEQLQFFLNCQKNNIPTFYQEQKDWLPLSFSNKLPLTIIIEQTGYKIICKILNKNSLKKSVTRLHFLKDKGLTYLFCNGIIKKIDHRLETFLTRLYERPFIVFDKSETISTLIKRIYKPNKSLCQWETIGNIESLIPKETTPVPILSITYKNQCLQTVLTYKYANQEIDPLNKDKEIIDKETGKKMIRIFSMEEVFQQDLMTLFEKNNLPFLLSNPGDIAKFFDNIIPELKNRQWVINSEVTDFNVIKEPVDLNFEIGSSSNNWFHFEPNCDLYGEQRSLLELSRLIVENQGYIKTKNGFVQVSKSSQEELSFLKQSGALSIGKTFKKKEILPIMMMTQTTSKNVSIKELISTVNSFNVKETSISKEFKGTLRSYQHYGVHWMNLLANVQLGGILADDMGLGKTIQALAYSSLTAKKGTVLVICPTAVLYNWKREIEKFLPKRKTLIYGGNQRFNELKRLLSYDFVIASYGVLKNDIDYLKSIEFSTIFADEAQMIKNPQAQVSKAIKLLQSSFKVVMTGTPIENHLQDIWNLFDFIMPNYLGNKNQFDVMIKDNNRDFLRTKVKPFILRREKREVLDSLPEKTEITLECPLSETQMQLYSTVLDAAKKGFKDANNKRNKLNMLTALLKLRQVCTHPNLIEEFKDLNVESAKFEMLKDKCGQLIDEGHKIVVFSQFTSMLNIIQNWTTKEGINIERIDGTISGKARMAAVDRFQTSEKPTIFLVSLKAGGVGLNLTAADYVIHIDPWWNPAIQAQATDRVHRMGQTNKVIVYKLICAGTIEEKIHNLQEEKKQLLAEIVDIDNASEKKLDFDQIKSLILN